MKKPSDIYSTGRKSPGARVTLVNPLDEPRGALSYMTADRVQAIFAAAEAGDMDDYYALARDLMVAHSHLQSELAGVKLDVIGEELVFTAAADDDQPAADAADFCEQQILACPTAIAAFNRLLQAIILPVSVVEKVYAPDGAGYRLAELVPVPMRLLDFRSGTIRIYQTDGAGRRLTVSDEVDPERYIVHRSSLLDEPDIYGGLLRSIVWWCLFSLMDRSWWVRFLERYGSPFLVGKYDPDRPEDRAVLESAFAYAVKIGGLVVSDSTAVEIQQAQSSNADAFEKFHQVACREITKALTGHTATSEAQGAALGSGVNDTADSKRAARRKWNARALCTTLRDQLCEQLLRLNGLPGIPPMLTFGGVSPAEMAAHATLLGSLRTAGLQLTDDGVLQTSRRFGLDLQRQAGGGVGFPSFAVNSIPAPQAAVDTLSVDASAILARLGRERAAGLLQEVRNATSPADLQERLAAWAASLNPSELAALQDSSSAAALNGLLASAP